MITDRFNIKRLPKLKKTFNKKNVRAIWKKLVRQQLRKLDIKDIYDYFDFNYYIDENIENIVSSILKGTYKPQTPLIYEIEKKLGITRHMCIPQPSDALVLQTITEEISKEILSKTPSKQAFYSRDRHNLKQLDDLESNFYETLRDLWIRYQEEILEFSEAKEYLVLTDLTNYFDSIRMRDLRSVFSSLTSKNEVYLDLLFFIIQELSWTPDYLPYSNHGLPTINIEAIRLLAHCFLFEADELLKKRTKETFVRWMDDIIFGIDQREEGLQILNKLSEVLKSRGLALNLSKTEIITSKTAEEYFYFSENKFLNKIPNRPTNNSSRNIRLLVILQKKFDRHVNRTNKARHWDKITKRYLTVFAFWKSSYPLKMIAEYYINFPSLRGHIAYYLEEMGFTPHRFRLLFFIASKTPIYDDISMNFIVNILLKWNFPVSKKTDSYIDQILKIIWKIDRSISYYYILLIYSKFKSPNRIINLIKRYSNKWKESTFLLRQSISILPRAIADYPNESHSVIKSYLHLGIPEVVSLANNLLELSELNKPDKRITEYLFPVDTPRFYPNNKFLILKLVLSSPNLNAQKRIDILTKADKFIKDFYYRRWLGI